MVMQSKMDRRRMYSRRMFMLGGINAVGIATLAGRLYHLQINNGATYRSLAENNRVRLELIPPIRGRIFDRNGDVIARNIEDYQLITEVKDITRIRELVKQLHAFVRIDEERIESLLAAYTPQPDVPFVLAQGLNWQELSKLEVHSPELADVSVQIAQSRYYPLREGAAHVTGYVGAISASDVAYRDVLRRMPQVKIGKQGIEHVMDEQLIGKAGIRHLEVNAHGRIIRELDKIPGHSGDDIQLALDNHLQKFAYQRLQKEKSAALALIDIQNGEMLALSSAPAFDPNRFSQIITTEHWKSLLKDPHTPLMDKTIAGQYPPGSTFKMITGLAALESGVATPESREYCPGFYKLGNHRFHCWKRPGHGWMDIRQALEQSCDVYFYTVAQQMGIDAIADMARRLGLGEKTGISLPNEKGGLIPDKDWKKRSYNKSWTAGDTINASIGQGYVLTTPLQLAVMTARIASGKAVSPHLIHQSNDAIVDFPPLDIAESYLEVIRDGMYRVVNAPRGTALGAKIHNPDWAMAGKTGTSQVKRLEKPGMNIHDIPWEARDHALFVGYAPVTNPRYAAAVVVEHGGSGSKAAAPIIRDMLEEVQSRADKA